MRSAGTLRGEVEAGARRTPGLREVEKKDGLAGRGATAHPLGPRQVPAQPGMGTCRAGNGAVVALGGVVHACVSPSRRDRGSALWVFRRAGPGGPWGSKNRTCEGGGRAGVVVPAEGVRPCSGWRLCRSCVVEWGGAPCPGLALVRVERAGLPSGRNRQRLPRAPDDLPRQGALFSRGRGSGGPGLLPDASKRTCLARRREGAPRSGPHRIAGWAARNRRYTRGREAVVRRRVGEGGRTAMVTRWTCTAQGHTCRARTPGT